MCDSKHTLGGPIKYQTLNSSSKIAEIKHTLMHKCTTFSPSTPFHRFLMSARSGSTRYQKTLSNKINSVCTSQYTDIYIYIYIFVYICGRIHVVFEQYFIRNGFTTAGWSFMLVQKVHHSQISYRFHNVILYDDFLLRPELFLWNIGKKYFSNEGEQS